MQMSETIKVGDWIKDNDPRIPDRVLEVTELLPNGVVASMRGKPGTGQTTIRLDRIKCDGKSRRYGWNLVQKP
jgi:hypothetical protein